MRSYMVALALLFIALGHPSFAQTPTSEAAASDAAAAGGADDVDPQLVKFDVRGYFTLNCTGDAVVSNIEYSWKKNDTLVKDIPDLRDRFKLEENGAVFKLSARATEDDFGNYTCLVSGDVAKAWLVHANTLARLPSDSNVVEGQKLKLTCKLIGKPYVRVAWTYQAEEGANVTDVPARANVSTSAAGVPGGELVLEAAERGDAGVYTCTPLGGAPASTVLRVKDMYAALWPFLGICLEVFVLCAIILVYEKRRTKPELDDSDTDNHEQ